MNKLMALFFILSFSVYAQTVTIEWNDVRQNIDGFGACDAWFSDEIMQHPDKNEMLDLLFKQDGGIGLSILRHRIPPFDTDWIDSSIELTSGDLDFGTRPYNAVRFIDVSVPRNASITNAYIQFTAKDNLSATCVLKIHGQASDNALTFAENFANISSRPQTSSVVTWVVPPWKNNEKTAKQQTVDLKNIVAEITSRDGWQSGNSLVFIFENTTGKRSARTFDDGADVAPELVINFNSDQQFATRVSASIDDAEENGKSYITYGAIVTKEAFARDCEKVWAAAWTPPPQWKTNNNPEEGGFLKQRHYQDWADYLERYRSEMEKRSGLPLYAISPQNEPGYKSWESCQWDKNDFKNFIKNNLGPTLDPSCRIIVPEETNWNNVDNFYSPIHNDATARSFIDIIAGHCYGGDPNVSYNHFGKPVWETEWSYDTSGEDVSISNGVTWAVNFWKLLVNSQASACHHWWMINLKDDGRQQGLIAAAPAKAGFSVAKRLWTIGNYSKFVRPGWHRIDATKIPLDDVYVAAFKDSTTHEFAIVAINSTTSNQAISFQFDGFAARSLVPHRTSSSENLRECKAITAGNSADVTLAAKSVTTFIGIAETETQVYHSNTAPNCFVLNGNFPNPFNPATTIKYSLAESANVQIDIFNVNGRYISTLIHETQDAGEHHVQWHANVAASGIYLYRVTVKTARDVFEQHHKMLLVR